MVVFAGEFAEEPDLLLCWRHKMIIKRSDAQIDSIYTDEKTAQEDVKKKANIEKSEEDEETNTDERD